jgi:hypothetical protein
MVTLRVSRSSRSYRVRVYVPVPVTPLMLRAEVVSTGV